MSRLVQMLGNLGRRMAALPPPKQDEPMADVPVLEGAEATGSGAQTPVPAAAGHTPTQPQQGGGGSGKGKKKKGKR